MIFVTNDFDPLITSAMEFFDRRTIARVTGNQKDRARAEGENLGYARGVAYVLSAMMTGERVKRYGKMTRIPALIENDVMHKIIRPGVAKWEELELDLPHDSNERKNLREIFIAWLVYEIDQLTFTSDLEEIEVSRHRKAVLAEEEPATEADREWLIKEMEAAREAWQKVSKIDPELAEFAEHARRDSSGDSD